MLRRLSLLVLSLWLGAGIGVSFVAIPVVFGFKASLPPGQSGQIAQAILLRLFEWQAGFAGLAGLLYALERWRQPGEAGIRRGWILPPIMAISLVALFWVHPRMAAMHRERYALETPENRRAELAGKFGAWHGAAQAGNLTVLIGVLACWQGVSHAVRNHVGRTKGDSPGVV